MLLLKQRLHKTFPTEGRFDEKQNQMNQIPESPGKIPGAVFVSY